MKTASRQPEDLAIITRLKAGDERALGDLYDRYGSLMLGVGCKMLGNREEAEDVMHDVFMEAWRKVQTYDADRGSVRAWLVLRMRSRTLDRIRSPARKRNVAADEITESKLPIAEMKDPKLRKEREAFASALAVLNDESAKMVELVYFHGLALGTVAERLGVPVGTVKSRLFAARKKLRDALTPLVDEAS